MAITKPYTFQAGAKARASEVNQDFDILYSEVNRIGTEILNLDIDIQNVAEGKADVNGNAGQVFKMADAVDSYDGVNKNFLENAIANMKDYISGLVISKNTDTSIRVSSGSCYDSTYTVVINNTGNITKTNTIQGAGTRYVHVISDNAGRQVDILISSQSISPALPSGYTKYRLIGSFVTDSSNKIVTISYFGNMYNNDNNPKSVLLSIMPDWSRRVSRAVTTNYTATQNGYLYIRVPVVEGNITVQLTINGLIFDLGSGITNREGNHSSVLFLPIAEGDTYNIYASTSRDWFSAYFIPMRGV